MLYADDYNRQLLRVIEKFDHLKPSNLTRDKKKVQKLNALAAELTVNLVRFHKKLQEEHIDDPKQYDQLMLELRWLREKLAAVHHSNDREDRGSMLSSSEELRIQRLYQIIDSALTHFVRPAAKSEELMESQLSALNISGFYVKNFEVESVMKKNYAQTLQLAQNLGNMRQDFFQRLGHHPLLKTLNSTYKDLVVLTAILREDSRFILDVFDTLPYTNRTWKGFKQYVEIIGRPIHEIKPDDMSAMIESDLQASKVQKLIQSLKRSLGFIPQALFLNFRSTLAAVGSTDNFILTAQKQERLSIEYLRHLDRSSFGYRVVNKQFWNLADDQTDINRLNNVYTFSPFTVLGGKLKGHYIVRELNAEAFEAWLRAYKAGLPVEQIVKYFQLPNGRVRVYCRYGGETLANVLKKYPRLSKQLNAQREQILAKLKAIGVTQGDPNFHNFVVSRKGDQFEMVIIDWELGKLINY